jgi:hypothetical protein
MMAFSISAVSNSSWAADEMIPDRDIYWAAQLLVNRHGGEATAYAALRAQNLSDAGDLDGAPVWREILRAVDELTRARRDSDR